VNKDELLIFERDEEYIEADRSPTHFESSSEEGDYCGIVDDQYSILAKIDMSSIKSKV
jgi:hypothetical protein